jgi:hypothetical protein
MKGKIVAMGLSIAHIWPSAENLGAPFSAVKNGPAQKHKKISLACGAVILSGWRPFLVRIAG